jgi:hypothetical protein
MVIRRHILEVLRMGVSPGKSGPSAEVITDQVWDEALSGHPTAGSSGKAVADIETNVGDPSGDTLTDLASKIGDIARSLDLILGSRWDASGDLGTDIASLLSDVGGGDMPVFTEFWDDEILNASDWEETLDGTSTGAIAVGNGLITYDLTSDAVAGRDVFLNSVKRWRCNPSAFGDSNDIVSKLVVEFMVQLTGNLSDHDNSYFFLGLNPAKSNVSGGSDVAHFYLTSDALRTITTVGAGNEANAVPTPPTLTNMNKYKIEVFQDQIDFYVNGTLKTSHTSIIPDKAMYLIIGSRAENAAAIGLKIGPVRVKYEEV